MNQRALQALGAVLRAAQARQGLSLRDLAPTARRRPEGLRRLLAGQGGAVRDLLPLARALGLEVTVAPRSLLAETVRRVCELNGVTLPGLQQREVLTPHELRLTAELLGELLRQKDEHGARRWQGTAREGIEALRAKYRRLAAPPKDRR